MGSNYLPTNDSQFSDWVDHFLSYIGLHMVELGLTEPDVTNLLNDHPAWDNSLTVHVNARAAAKGACATKDTNRSTLETDIRTVVRKILANPAITDAQREGLGLKPKESDAFVVGPLSESDDRPLGVIDISTKLRHVIRIENVNSTGTSKGKPANALGCEVWRKIGAPPSGAEDDLEYMGLVTNNKLVAEYPATEGGKQAYYMLRWVNGKGEKSAWSDAETATIAA